MAVLHQATLSPTKLDVLSAHLLTLDAFAGSEPTDVSLVAAYRFDDPAGAVGIESHIVDSGAGRIAHIPLTYRDAPLEGAEQFLLTTMDHSALGPRWVYNACGDPVYVTELTRAILTGATSVDQFVDTPDGMVFRPSTASAAGTGSTDARAPLIDSVVVTTEGSDTVIAAGGLEIVVRHLLSGDMTQVKSLVGTWIGNDTATTLAFIR